MLSRLAAAICDVRRLGRGVGRPDFVAVSGCRQAPHRGLAQCFGGGDRPPRPPRSAAPPPPAATRPTHGTCKGMGAPPTFGEAQGKGGSGSARQHMRVMAPRGCTISTEATQLWHYPHVKQPPSRPCRACNEDVEIYPWGQHNIQKAGNERQSR